MKVTVKTINPNSVVVLELEPSATVGTIKERIAAEKGEAFKLELQKLIHAGKILGDNAVTLEALKITEKDFFVCMPTKPQQRAAPESSSSSSAAAAPAPAEAAKKAEKAEKPAESPAAKPAPAPAPTSEQAAAEAFTSLATGAHLEQAVKSLVEMGYPHEKVVRAMRAAFNNPDRAAEYLLTDSIPAEPAAAPATPASGAPAANVASPAAGTPATSGEPQNLFALAEQERQQQQQQGMLGSGAAGGAGALAALRNSPQFAQLRQLVQSNPQLLEPLLAQMGASNPALLQMLSSNPQALGELLGEGLEDLIAAGSGDEGASPLSGAPPPGAQVVQLTADEAEAVNRLVSLGFDRNIAVEAYLACDKNEELAANYLFDSAGDA